MTATVPVQRSISLTKRLEGSPEFDALAAETYDIAPGSPIDDLFDAMLLKSWDGMENSHRVLPEYVTAWRLTDTVAPSEHDNIGPGPGVPEMTSPAQRSR